MPGLASRLRTDLTAAMRAREELRVAALRMALSALQTEAVAGDRARELDDDEVLAVLRREVRKRREAATAYRDGGRPELAGREEAEAEVLTEYLPVQLDDAELEQVVRAALRESAATGMGPAMRAATAAVAGRADGARVAGVVRRLL